jgi:thymidine phosphorylase
VAAGEPVFTLYTDTPELIGPALAELDGGWSIGNSAPPQRPLIIDRITL